MTIKTNHKHVDMEGLVFLPYLHEWNSSSNLVTLITTACQVFSSEPPLFAKPKIAPPPISTSAASTSVSMTGSAATPYSASVFAARLGNGNPNPSTYALPPSSSSSSSSSSVHPQLSGEALLKAKREKLIQDITMTLYSDLHDLQMKIRDELNTEFNHEQYLSYSQGAAESNLDELKRCIVSLRDSMNEVEEKRQALRSWSEQAEVEEAKIEMESRFEPYDDLSAQIVRLNAEISAIDDAFYHLERCLVAGNNKTVDLTVFLKETRKLARQQFLCRAHLRKINAFCMQQQHQQWQGAASGKEH